VSIPYGPVLTLEPFIDGVRAGVEGGGWELSGLQKTTSHEYAGRWEGDSTRSAYLFFHRPDGAEGISVEGFLDETSRGLQGNVSLVVEGPPLARLGDARAALAAAAAAVRRRIPAPRRAAVSLKLRMEEGSEAAEDATTELRVKARVTQAALREGVGAVAESVAMVVRAFEQLLEDREIARYSESQ
jgi:hypothetical protein